MEELIELAKLYLKKWFGGTKVTSKNNSISISQKNGILRVNGKLIDSITKECDDECYTPLEVETAINKVLTPKIEAAIFKIFTDQMIDDALRESNVYSDSKRIIGQKIRNRIIRDADNIVDEALGDLEDSIELTGHIRRHVLTTLKGVFR